MLKWILIGASVIVLGVIATMIFSYRQITAAGPTAAVMVATTPERAWSWISSADSLQSLHDSTKKVTATGSGTLQVGDSLRVYSKESNAPEGATPYIIWVVSGVDAPRTRSFSARQDPSKPGSIERVDSVTQVGDSVRISSSYSVATDANSAVASKGKIESAMLGSAAKVLVGAMRFSSQNELDQLKLRLERP